MWHKADWMGHPMRLELTLAGLLVKLANHYTTGGAQWTTRKKDLTHLSLSLSLSFYGSLSLSLSFFSQISLSFFLRISLSFFLFTDLSLSLSFYGSLSLSLSFHRSLSLSLSFFLRISLSFLLFTDLSLSLSTDLSLFLSSHRSLSLSLSFFLFSWRSCWFASKQRNLCPPQTLIKCGMNPLQTV